jgi:hypothetical protein
MANQQVAALQANWTRSSNESQVTVITSDPADVRRVAADRDVNVITI